MNNIFKEVKGQQKNGGGFFSLKENAILQKKDEEDLMNLGPNGKRKKQKAAKNAQKAKDTEFKIRFDDDDDPYNQNEDSDVKKESDSDDESDDEGDQLDADGKE